MMTMFSHFLAHFPEILPVVAKQPTTKSVSMEENKQNNTCPGVPARKRNDTKTSCVFFFFFFFFSSRLRANISLITPN